MTILMMHVNDPIPPLEQFEVPDSLKATLRTAMAKVPHQRFSSAGEMVNALTTPPVINRPPQRETMIDTDDTGMALGDDLQHDPGVTKVDVPSATDIQRQRSRRTNLDVPAPSGGPRRAVGQVHAPTGRSPQEASGRGRNIWLWAGGIGALLVLSGIVLFATDFFGGGGGGATPTPLSTEVIVANITDTPEPEIEPTETEVPATEEPTVTELPTETPTNSPVPPTATSEPTNTPLPTNTPIPPTATLPPPTATSPPPPTNTPVPPTATVAPQPTAAPTDPPVVGNRALINSISINGDVYSVNYTVSGFAEDGTIATTHVHVYWNSFREDQAGAGPTAGSWDAYPGFSPHTRFGVSSRPGDATAICIVVANPDHTIQPGTGNCSPLP